MFHDVLLVAHDVLRVTSRVKIIMFHDVLQVFQVVLEGKFTSIYPCKL